MKWQQIFATMICLLIVYALGWVILIDGGVSIQIRRQAARFIGGNLGMLFGAGFFFLAFCFTYALAKILRLPNIAIAVSALLIFVPPMAFIFYK